MTYYRIQAAIKRGAKAMGDARRVSENEVVSNCTDRFDQAEWKVANTRN
jgi:hypothetical protein